MIRIERDPGFWRWVTDSPEVRAGALLDPGAVLDQLIADPAVVPVAGANGGYLFLQRDGAARVYELHSLFRPEGWGREVVTAGKAALALMFRRGMDILFTYSVDGAPRSRPPKSLGFAPAGEHVTGLGRRLQTWALTRADWRQATGNSAEEDDALADLGRRFHAELEAGKLAAGSHLPTHPEDDFHDRAVGACVAGILAGSPQQAVASYNLWASASGYQSIELNSVDPVVIDIRDAVVQAQEGRMVILACR